jgi:hypothetical protein
MMMKDFHFYDTAPDWIATACGLAMTGPISTRISKYHGYISEAGKQ